MKINLLILGFALIPLAFCGSRDKSLKNQGSEISESRVEKAIPKQSITEVMDYKLILCKSIPDTSKIFKLNGDCVFFSQLNDQESDSLEKADASAYEVMSENGNNASLRANEILTSLSINQYWSDRRFVNHSSVDSSYYLDTRHPNHMLFNCCILFKSGTNPKIILTELLTEKFLTTYYNK